MNNITSFNCYFKNCSIVLTNTGNNVVTNITITSVKPILINNNFYTKYIIPLLNIGESIKIKYQVKCPTNITITGDNIIAIHETLKPCPEPLKSITLPTFTLPTVKSNVKYNLTINVYGLTNNNTILIYDGLTQYSITSNTTDATISSSLLISNKYKQGNNYTFSINKQPPGQNCIFNNNGLFSVSYLVTILGDTVVNCYCLNDTGSFIQNSILINNNMLYYNTISGGYNNNGTINSYNLLTQQTTVIYAFGTDPNINIVRFVDNSGNLYGLTTDASGKYPGVCLFKLTNTTNGYQISIVGNSGADPINGILGYLNENLIIDSNNNFYGVLPSGGLYSDGVVFTFIYNNIQGNYTYKVLYNFSNTNNIGGNPSNSLTLNNGDLYGTTGTSVFKLKNNNNDGIYTPIFIGILSIGVNTNINSSNVIVDSYGNVYTTGNNVMKFIPPSLPNQPYTLQTLPIIAGGAGEENNTLSIDNLNNVYGSIVSNNLINNTSTPTPYGAVFKISSDSTTVSYYSFSNSNNISLPANITFNNNIIYGICANNVQFNSDTQLNNNVIYELTPANFTNSYNLNTNVSTIGPYVPEKVLVNLPQPY